jgi:mitochondrial enoyl-[acyl-carrier protein] reductase / trans-2-enoyl-CoA reductase
MKQVQMKSFGNPEDVVEVVEMPDLKVSANDEVLVRVQLAPVGPADIGTFWGRYPRQDPESVVPGIEAIGVVEAVGVDVTDIETGDRVLVLAVDTWSEQLLLKRAQVARVSKDGDILQQFTLKSNGSTAALLLSSFVDLLPGDWIAQNGANSTVGQYIVQIARARGFRTINIVRNRAGADQVRRLGGDVVVIDGPEAANEIQAATESANVRLAVDCISGEASTSMADILGQRGTLVVYGGLSGQAVQVRPLQLITKDIGVRGFWITRWFLEAPNGQVQELIDELDAMASHGSLVTEVASLHKLADIKTALRKASDGGRNGKVVLDFRDAWTS